MPELPEIFLLAKDMDKGLVGKEIREVTINQNKCVNKPIESIQKELPTETVKAVNSHGKWLQLELTMDKYLLINLGMGGDLIYFTQTPTEKKYQFRLDFTDNSGFTIRFWWFGYVHLVEKHELTSHSLTSKLGPSVYPDLTIEQFRSLMEKKPRQGVKSFLLDQKNLAGIGNFYIHDILFNAKLHPLQKVGNLSIRDRNKLFIAINEVFRASINLGAADYEKNFWGETGGFGQDQLAVGYKEGKPCPNCSTAIEKIKTGGTSHFLCPHCQVCD